MADTESILRRVRRALGDQGKAFRVAFSADQEAYDLGHRHITDPVISLVSGSVVTDLPAESYELDAYFGTLVLDQPLAEDSSLLVTGTGYALFSDEELEEYISDALTQHTHERTDRVRTRDPVTGFIEYVETPITLANLPPVEEELVAVLATILALWDLATDAATDVDVVTAEGTHLSRAQRYQQLMAHIASLREWYQTQCQQLQVGLSRIQMSTLRRVSRTTGRLVPIFREREYDEMGPDSWPVRLLPPIDAPNEDTSGIPSPIWGGFGGY
jgi:hypothetical protein